MPSRDTARRALVGRPLTAWGREMRRYEGVRALLIVPGARVVRDAAGKPTALEHPHPQTGKPARRNRDELGGYGLRFADYAHRELLEAERRRPGAAVRA